MILSLVQNVALLVALAVGLQVLAQRLEKHAALYSLTAGVLFGAVGVVGMMMPVEFMPGVIYDGRSIVLALAGLFGGPAAGALAAVTCAAYRLHLGGVGVVVGVAVIVEAASLGIGLFYLRRGDRRWESPLWLWAFGVLVHLGMLALQLGLPGGAGWEVLRRVGPGVLILFPLGFVVIAQVLLEGERRRRAQAAAHHKDVLLREMGSIAKVGGWEFDPATGTGTWTDEVARIHDLSPSQEPSVALGMRYYRGWSREKIEQAFKEAVEQGRPYDLELEMVTGEGNHKWVRTIGRPVTENGRVVRVRGTIQDITDRKTTEAELQRERDLLARIMETSPVGVTVLDRDGRITRANLRAEKVLGLSREQITRRTYNAPDWRITDCEGNPFPERELPFRRVMDTGAPVFDVSYAIEWSDGRRVLLSVNAAPILSENGEVERIVATVEDITERTRSEAELKRLQLAIEQAAEVIIITGADGAIQYVNPAFERVTGYTREEALGRTPRILKSGEQDEAFYRELWGTISSGRTWQGRMVNRRRDGSLFTEEAAISPVHDAGGRIVNYVGVKRDITEELELEQQYRQAQKMEAVGRLAGGVAHDFNNMLSVILGRVELVLVKLAASDPLYDNLLEVRHAAERSAQLTRQLLAFARRQTVEPRVLDLNETV
ncbi:MAG: PAS domain S-box protein, partial [Spirochaetota bacterium]